MKPFRYQILSLALLLGWLGSLPAAPLSFRDEAILGDFGLRLPLPSDARAQPLPPLRTYDYTLRRGNESWTEERFDPFELWYASQHVAQWRLEDGSVMRLGMVTSILPSGFESRHVTREHFEQIAASASADIGPFDARLAQRWMLDFAGQQVSLPVQLSNINARLAGLLRFESDNPRTHAYLFRFNRGRAGQAHMADLWLGLVVSSAGVDPAVDRDVIERELLGRMGPTSRFANRSTAPRGGDRFRRTANVREHPIRTAAHRSVSQLDDWWALDSEDYVVLSNHSDGAQLAADLLEDLQEARALYARFVPGFAPTTDDVSVVRIFATDAEYEAYVGPDHVWTAGVFDAMRRELVIRSVSSRRRDAQYERMQRVALHEAFHQYLFQATGGIPTSPWFNEGHAVFFEAAEIGKRRVSLGESPDRVKRTEQLVAARALNLPSLLRLNYAGFYGGSSEQRLNRYSAAWGLIYFLQRAAPLERNRPHDDILTRYMAALEMTRNPDAATAIAFEGIDLGAFEEAVNSFWKTSRSRQAARRAPLP